MDTVKKPSAKGGRRRAVHFVLRDDECPGLIDFLDSLENRMESKTVRAILFKWFEDRQEEGSMDMIAAAVKTVHDHDLAVLQRKVQPHLAVSTRVAAAPERKQVAAPVALVQASQPVEPRTVAAAVPPPDVILADESVVAPPVAMEVERKDFEEKPASAEGDPVVSFLDNMLGI